MKHVVDTLILGAGLALVAAPAAAPVAAQVAVAPAPRGWIGVSFELTTTRDGDRVQTANRVTDVLHGSPAHDAGVRPGDVLVSLNGMDWNQAYGSAIQSLRPGDRVVLVVERAGRLRELRLTAGSRPADETIFPSWSMTFTPDSMAERLYMAMDSLRIRIVEGQRVEVRVGPDRTVALAPFDVRVPEGVAGVAVPEVRAPFQFHFFGGEGQDSLRTAMAELNQEIRSVRARQTARLRELSRNAGGQQARIDRGDTELRRLDEELTRLGRRADELRASMEEAGREEAMARVRTLESLRGSEVTPQVVTLRPMAPYVLGQNRAAGAEVVELRPELAAYFQVEGGVLVVDAPQGTPAAEAGIQPGDVLTHVAGTAVGSIAELRRGLSIASGEIPVTLVRKGRRLQVLLGR